MIYKIAQKFTEIYDEIAQVYPIFERLKKLSKAIAMAQWIWINEIPIDVNLLRDILEE
jgi:hypothetical protein